jgi:predicted RNase H-like HicB family nuclease
MWTPPTEDSHVGGTDRRKEDAHKHARGLARPVGGTRDLSLSYRDFKENGQYLVECPELRLMDQGKTKAEAYKHLAENIVTTLAAAIETGSLKAHMKALGFKETKIPMKPHLVTFDILNHPVNK